MHLQTYIAFKKKIKKDEKESKLGNVLIWILNFQSTINFNEYLNRELKLIIKLINLN